MQTEEISGHLLFPVAVGVPLTIKCRVEPVDKHMLGSWAWVLNSQIISEIYKLYVYELRMYFLWTLCCNSGGCQILRGVHEDISHTRWIKQKSKEATVLIILEAIFIGKVHSTRCSFPGLPHHQPSTCFILSCELFMYVLQWLDCKILEGRTVPEIISSSPYHTAWQAFGSVSFLFLPCPFWEGRKANVRRQEGETKEGWGPLLVSFSTFVWNVELCLKWSQGKMVRTTFRHVKKRSQEKDVGKCLKIQLSCVNKEILSYDCGGGRVL